ncbi:MAG: hypothetical protein M3R70_04370 [Actinomycetota bacterium]|nr:hypothetical protein [Actinomycetota bacterium]
MLRAAFRRFFKLLAVIGAATAVVSLAIGLLLGASLVRSLAIGLYLVGSFFVIAGFFMGNRGPVRMRDDRATLLFGPRWVRWATREEQDEAMGSSAVFITLGFALIFLAAAADTRQRLF